MNYWESYENKLKEEKKKEKKKGEKSDFGQFGTLPLAQLHLLH